MRYKIRLSVKGDRMKKNKPVFFKKMFNTTLSFFLIPMFLSSVVGILMATFLTMAQLKSVYSENVMRISYVMENQFNFAKDLANSVANNDYVVGMSRKEYNLLEFKEIQYWLVDYLIKDNVVEDIVLYMDDKPASYSTQGVYPNYETVTGYKISRQYVHQYLNEPANYYTFNKVAVQQASSTKYSIAYATKSYSASSCSVVVLLNITMLGKTFNTEKSNFNESGFEGLILDEHKNIIYSSTYLNEDNFEKIIQNIERGRNNEISHLSFGDYLISFITSEENNLTYLYMVPMSGIYIQMIKNALLIILGACIVFIIAYKIIKHITNINYTPIRSLYQSAIGITEPSTSNENEENEFSAVNKAFNNLKSTVDDLNDHITKNMDSYQMSMIYHLLNGKFASFEQFNLESEFADMHLSKRYYWVISLKLKKDNDSDVVEIVKGTFSGRFQCFGAPTLNPKQYVFIVMADDEKEGEKQIEASFGTLKGKIQNAFVVTTSRCYEDIEDIGKAYIESHTAIETISPNESKLVSFNQERDTSQLLKAMHDLDNCFVSLKRAIHEGELAKIKILVDEIIYYIQSQKLDIFTVRCICYDLINHTIRSINDLVELSSPVKDAFPQITRLVEFETFDELSHTIYEISTIIYSMLGNDKEYGKNISIDAVISYIKDNYTKYDFSVQQIAEKFMMSLSSLSQYFKANMEVTVIEYVLELRIERAKMLLLDSNMNISDIVGSVGYISVPSFVNRFKKIVGLTPGEYRQSMKQ